MSNKNKETISDEQLMAYADNELDDIELIERIESSPELQQRLLPFTETGSLMQLMQNDLPDEMISEDLKWMLDQKDKKNTNDSKISWISRLKNNIGTLSASLSHAPSYLLAASMILIVGVYMSMQTEAPEWRDRYASLGFDDTTIESEGWFESVKNTSYYSLSPINNGVGELTLKANSLGTNQSINNQTDQQNTNEKYFSNIDSKLNSSFLRGVLNNMIEKNSSYANISISETKMLNIDLLGYDTLKNNCILGEISNKNNTIKDTDIPSKFFYYCAYDFNEPFKLIN